MILRGGTWQIIGQLTPLIVNIALTPVIISGLGMSRYGLFMLVTTMSLVLTQLDGGIHGAAQRYFAIYSGAGERSRSTSLLVSVLLVVVAAASIVFAAGWFLAPPVIGLFNVPPELESEGVYLLRAVVAIIAVAQVRNLFAALINAQGKFALTNANNLAGHALYVVGLLLTLSQGWGLRGVAWTLVSQQVLATVLVVPAGLRLLERRGLRLMRRGELGDFLGFGLRVQWSGAANLVNLQADALIVGAVLPVSSVGVLTAGSNFANQVRMVPINVMAPVRAVLGRGVGEGDPIRARRLFEQVQQHWVTATAGWGVLGACAAGFGVPAWLGPEFSLSGVVAAVILVGLLPNLMAQVLTVWTQALGQPSLPARAATVGALVNIALTLALIFPFGIIGTVVATAVSQIISAEMLRRLAHRRLDGGVRPFWRDVPLAAAITTAAVVVAFELVARPWVPQGALGLLTCGALAIPGAVTYVSMTVGLRRARRVVVERLRASRAPAR